MLNVLSYFSLKKLREFSELAPMYGMCSPIVVGWYKLYWNWKDQRKTMNKRIKGLDHGTHYHIVSCFIYYICQCHINNNIHQEFEWSRGMKKCHVAIFQRIFIIIIKSQTYKHSSDVRWRLWSNPNEYKQSRVQYEYFYYCPLYGWRKTSIIWRFCQETNFHPPIHPSMLLLLVFHPLVPHINRYMTSFIRIRKNTRRKQLIVTMK